MRRKSCLQCQRPLQMCYCHCIKHLANHWPIHILQHPKEAKHAIGTAKIAELSLDNCTIHIGNNLSDCSALRGVIDKQEPILVYPGETSIPLQNLSKENPKPLIFIDSTWRKATRILHESPDLSQLPSVSIDISNTPRYRIRKIPGKSAFSTLEAISYTLSILEDNQEKYQSLINTMDWMIEKQIELMGRHVFEKNYMNK